MLAGETFQTVARVGEIAEGVGYPCEVAGRHLAVFRVDERYFAVDDTCPHQEFPLHDGTLDGCVLTCIYHGWRFRLEDGAWLDDPRVRVGTYPVRVVGDEVQVSVDPDE